MSAEPTPLRRALRGLARALSDLGLHGAAAAIYGREWARGKRSASLACLAATQHLHAGQVPQALAFYREAVRREPGDGEARAGLVCALHRAGETRQAATEAARLAADAPCAEMWALVAELRRKSGDTVGSIEAFRLAAKSDGAAGRFVLGEAVLGESAWNDLASSLQGVHQGERAFGVGTHLVRSRATLVARALRAKREVAAAALALLAATSSAQTAPSVASASAPPPSAEASPSPSPTTRYRPEILKALPAASSVAGRAVRLEPGFVTEREEGAGLFPAEPSRFSWRGGSWTQSRVAIDGFDVTDPYAGGRPVAWGATELGEVEAFHDERGVVLGQTHGFAARGASTPRVVAQASLGLFDKTGTTADPLPSLARGRHLYDGFVSFSGGRDPAATQWSGTLSGTDVLRSERDSDIEKSTARVAFEARGRRQVDRDTFQALGLYQGRRAPYGLTTAETRANGLVAGFLWSRVAAGPDREGPRARATFRRLSSDDPAFLDPLLFERLVNGTPFQQAPYDTRATALDLDGGVGIGSPRDDLRLSVDASLSLATSRHALAQPDFVALERLNGLSARQWTFKAGAPARVSQSVARVGGRFDWRLGEATSLRGALALERLDVHDRDGGSIVGSTRLLPSLRFDWRRSERTQFFAEASMDTPPTPLATYEPATAAAPTLSARLWTDANRDGRVVPLELGAEVARRGPGSITADPDLTPPSMRQIAVGFATRVFGLGIRGVAYARRDRSLIETALNPRGAEILRLRALADPSGDILGASDDQVLGVAEENAASFTGSRYLLTNPEGHRALGEGAELMFDARSEHVFWGLSAAAFRDSGRGGNRGLRVAENDFGVVGESFDRLNTDTFAYGRLFFDRAYSLKMHLVAKDIGGFDFGALGRYDDGQPFARLVILNDLPQGPDFVQAIPRGRARLHYTLSVDARVSRRFELSGGALEVSASVFNALGSQFEAEEQVVWLPDYRRITMAQPPRSFVIALRFER